MLNIAIRAVRIAGNLILKQYERYYINDVSQKHDKYILNKTISEADSLIKAVIRKAYPNHVILGKEEISEIKKTEIQWIIIPLDGAINFIKRFPHFAISIAVRTKNRTEISVVYDPIRNELFTALRGQGTKLNEYRLRCNTVQNMNDAILATEFPLKNKQHNEIYISLINKLFKQSVNFRYTGSTVLDLAYLAAGRVDGFFEINFKPWSFIIGELLVREAGGLITDFIGSNNYVFSGEIAAGNVYILKAILLTIHNKIKPSIRKN